MKNCSSYLLIISLIVSLLVSCSDPIKQELAKPSLRIKIRNDTGKIISGATVKLYKDSIYTGAVQISDSTGLVVFADLDAASYYWLAQKGCATNRISQMSIGRALNPGAVHYGYSVLAETGTLKIVNNSPEAYKVSDSLFNITLKKDSPYIAHRRVRSYLIRAEKVSTPATTKDTLVRIRCGDTTILNIPF